MTIPKPVSFTQVPSAGYEGPDPAAFVIIGDVPGGGGEPGPVAWADVTGKPTTFAPIVGTTATTAAAGNHTHAAAVVTVSASAGIVGANVQAVLADLAARVVALETP